MDLDPTLYLTYLIDILFGVLAIILVHNIFRGNATISARFDRTECGDPLKCLFTKSCRTRFISPFCISAFALAVLLYFYLNSTMEIVNVWLNSHQQTPLLYKISGLWGNHEGSMLFFFTLLTAWATRLRDSESIRLASFVLLLIGGYMYLAANPFGVITVKMVAGQDLNPALQNPYLMIHPPILYAGQTLCFLLWIKACITPDDPKIPFYARLCFFLLTLGIALGARWAYGELGWGGFWFWDPVETVSLFPWLAIAAAVHTAKSDSARQRYSLLIAFPMVMLGLTLVRSGVLASVHSFGFDAFNGIWLGACTVVVVSISVVILSLRRRRENPELLSPSLSVEKRDPVSTFRILTPFSFLYALIILCTLILVPVIARIIFAKNISIDEHFFHQYINPFILVGLVFAGLAPRMKAHPWSFFSAILCAGLWCCTLQSYFHVFAICAALVGFWLILSSLNYAKHIFNKGFVAAHLGVGLCILGASHAEIFTTKKEFVLSNLPPAFASFPLCYISHTQKELPNITKEILTVSVDKKILQPEIQYFHISHATKHQTAIVQIGLDDIHATVFKEGNRISIELTHKPLINLFWLGVIVVLFGIGVGIKICRQNSF